MTLLAYQQPARLLDTEVCMKMNNWLVQEETVIASERFSCPRSFIDFFFQKMVYSGQISDRIL